MRTVRPLDPERDAEEAVGLIREAFPVVVTTPESWLHRVRTLPERAEHEGWVVEEDGRMLANAWAFRSFWSEGSTTAFCNVLVAGPHRRQGIGAMLFDLVEERVRALAAKTLLASFEETDAGVSFARARGFEEARAEQNAVLELAHCDARPPDGVDIRPLRDDTLRDAYAIDMAATADMPTTEPIDSMPYDEWVEELLELPTFSRAGSFVAYVDGQPAAVSLLAVDASSGRSLNMFTGTMREFRGRGLGLAVKLASIAWAKEQGISQMTTRNDETNAAMLAINRKLGFVPAGRQVEYLRAETASSRERRAPATSPTPAS